MSITWKQATIEQLAVTPGATIYIAPANTTSQVTFANATNEDATAVTFTIHVVTSGGALAATNIYVDAKPLAPGESDTVPEVVGVILATGDFIIAFADTAAAVNLKLGIKEIV